MADNKEGFETELSQITEQFNSELKRLDPKAVSVAMYLRIYETCKAIALSQGRSNFETINQRFIDAVNSIIQNAGISNFEDVFTQAQEIAKPVSKDLDTLKSGYEQSIKTAYVESGNLLKHATGISPEEMEDGKIQLSKNRENQYLTSIGDYVFASSEEDSQDMYVARANTGGMYAFEKFCITGGDNIQNIDNQQRRVLLKKPAYVYSISPQKFNPVTNIETRNGNPVFVFGQEWISDEAVDINDKSQVPDIETVKDITSILEHTQLFCNTGKNRDISREIMKLQGNDRISAIRTAIMNGELRYINGEADRNVLNGLEGIQKQTTTKAQGQWNH